MKNRNSLKDINLRSLIIIPRIAGTNLISTPLLTSDGFVSESQNIIADISRVQHKIVKIMDINIKRLEKVRNKLLESGRETPGQIISKLDNMINLFKKQKPRLHKIKSIEDITKISKFIEEIALKNDVKLGKVFDKKDSKIEKALTKMESKLHHMEIRISSEQIQDETWKEHINKQINKAQNLIDQLRYENIKEKEKFEVKAIRRKLNETLEEIQKSVV
ncbi:MAG: hypothetical protein WCJ19_01535 [bacterium]